MRNVYLLLVTNSICFFVYLQSPAASRALPIEEPEFRGLGGPSWDDTPDTAYSYPTECSVIFSDDTVYYSWDRSSSIHYDSTDLSILSSADNHLYLESESQYLRIDYMFEDIFPHLELEN